MTTDLDAQARAADNAYWEAEQGIGEIPPYKVTVDPGDGAFVVLHDPDLSPVERARVGGDVARRFARRAAAPLDSTDDPFAGLRILWPLD